MQNDDNYAEGRAGFAWDKDGTRFLVNGDSLFVQQLFSEAKLTIIENYVEPIFTIGGSSYGPGTFSFDMTQVETVKMEGGVLHVVMKPHEGTVG